MEPLQIAFLIFFCFIGGIGYWSYVASYLRFSKSRSTWTRTTGRVEWFGLNYGKPSISYAYMTNGKTFNGSKFTPGPLVNPKESGTWFPKSTYLKTDRTLKFLPGGTVEVFYDPTNPSDAALLLDPPSAKSVLLVSLILGLLVVGFLNCHWISQNKEIVIPLVAALFGLFFALLMGIRWVHRYLASRRFPSTSGKLIAAEVARSSSGRNSTGYYIMLDVSILRGESGIFRVKGGHRRGIPFLKSGHVGSRNVIGSFLRVVLCGSERKAERGQSGKCGQKKFHGLRDVG